jgi:hypothetical protein
VHFLTALPLLLPTLRLQLSCWELQRLARLAASTLLI